MSREAHSFWSAFEEAEAERAAAKREALRAEREAALLRRIPDAAERVCCTLRHAPEDEICDGPCVVIAALL